MKEGRKPCPYILFLVILVSYCHPTEYSHGTNRAGGRGGTVDPFNMTGSPGGYLARLRFQR